ncbi:MAG: pantetheine-phosphate adenylyltransferase [Bacteroidales bacterium]|jgi:pantetheine-phosphate adenylyltransferase|nr:pantetheine-phosphate adenylyltransferase [Bacteroidales bacterium]
MPNIAIFAGSFDPITKGHENIVHRALPLFDKIIVAVGHNADKKSFFSIEQRVDFIKKTFADTPKIFVETYDGLTVDFAKKHNANFLLRGLRNSADFEFERNIASVNKDLLPNLETVFMCTEPAFSHISSSVVRDILRHNGDATLFLPNVLSVMSSEV